MVAKIRRHIADAQPAFRIATIAVLLARCLERRSKPRREPGEKSLMTLLIARRIIKLGRDAVAPGRQIILLQLNGPLVDPDRLAHPTLIEQQQAEIGADVDKAGVVSQRLAVTLFSR